MSAVFLVSITQGKPDGGREDQNHKGLLTTDDVGFADFVKSTLEAQPGNYRAVIKRLATHDETP